MLEFLASIIGPQIDLVEDNLPPLSCILSMTDITTSAGWLRKSNFTDDGDEECDAHIACKLELARDHALRLMHNRIKEYSQWFPGDKNSVSDALSRDSKLKDTELTHLFYSLFPSQLPQYFTIAPLPQEIESFLSVWMQKMPARDPPRERRTSSGLHLGTGGQPSSNLSRSKGTHSLTPSNQNTKLDSSVALPNQSETSNIRLELSAPWLQARSELPWTMWLRPSGTTSARIRGLTKGESLHAFYRDSTRAKQTRIRQQKLKKQCPSQSSAHYTQINQPTELLQ